MEVVYRLRMMGMVRYALIGSLEFFEGFHSTHYAGKTKRKTAKCTSHSSTEHKKPFVTQVK